ncbi:MAG: hypothetical protein HC833_07890 [Leptolyngbyaceae cyanobacterium RM1_406_9]|nr:hypothetical protein [Leptolyngbyaceae cyanobacterium RM1_406_9]
MTLQDLANISQIAQAILVIISLGFIWYQLREGVRLAKSENARSLAEQAEAFNALIIQNPDLAELWYSYGKTLEKGGEINRLRYREMLVQNLIFHEYIYYQWKNKLLDDEIYRSWSSYLEHIVKRHNLDVISSGVQNIFPGDFGRYISQIRAKP